VRVSQILLARVFHAPAEDVPTEAEQQWQAESLAGVHALVVDDEPDVRMLLTLTLEGCGTKVQAAASGKEALKLLARRAAVNRFDVLIYDIEMPDEDGFAVMRRVRALPPDKGGEIPAIALTAYGREEIPRPCVGGGLPNPRH
jgi:CheY-like chemotaxis protein